MVKYQTRRRPVFCMNCAHEFISQVAHPHCSVCGSSQVVDSKEVSIDTSATMIRTEMKRSFKELRGIEIQPLVNGYFLLKKNIGEMDMALRKYAETIKAQDQRIQQLERKIRAARF